MKNAKLSATTRKRLARLPQERFSRWDPYPAYPLKPSVPARDPASGASGSGVEASPHPFRPAPYTTRCRNSLDLLTFLASPHGDKKDTKQDRRIHRIATMRGRLHSQSLHTVYWSQSSPSSEYASKDIGDPLTSAAPRQHKLVRHLGLEYQGSCSTRK